MTQILVAQCQDHPICSCHLLVACEKRVPPRLAPPPLSIQEKASSSCPRAPQPDRKPRFGRPDIPASSYQQLACCCFQEQCSCCYRCTSAGDPHCKPTSAICSLCSLFRQGAQAVRIVRCLLHASPVTCIFSSRWYSKNTLCAADVPYTAPSATGLQRHGSQLWLDWYTCVVLRHTGKPRQAY